MRFTRHFRGRKPRRPSAIRQRKVGTVKNGAKIRMFVRIERPVRTRHRDPVGPISLPDPMLHQAQDRPDVDDMDGGAENLGAGWKFRLLS